MQHLQFEKMYETTSFCLKKSCTHPSIPIDRNWAWQIGLKHGLYTMGFVSVVYSFSINMTKGDFSRAYSDAIMMIVYLAVTAQNGAVLWFRDPLNTLIQKTEENFELADILPVEHQSLVVKYARRGRWVMNLWYFTNLTMYTLYVIKAAALSLHSLYAGEFRLFLFYDYTFPPALEEIKYRYEVFPLIIGLQIFYGLYALRSTVGFCSLGPIFILNACAQLELVAMKIKTIFNEHSEREVAKKFVDIVRSLQNIYSYVRLINEVFKIMYELNLKMAALMMPVLIYHIIERVKQGEMCFEYILLACKAVLYSYLPCFYSNLLMEKGEAVRLAIYECGWEQVFDKSSRNSLIIMLTVALQPISIRTIFRTVCLDAFADLCRQSYAIFNLINTIWD
uniref:Odorant receptor n=1 Tax=Epiphyas postvittana TaxID=65032 RepID=A0A0K8TVD8_EPIPO